MILQALTQYYEDLLRLGKITPAGWSKAKVSYAIDIGDNGQIIAIYDLRDPTQKGKKVIMDPQESIVPFHFQRSGKKPPSYFLCDTPRYLLGVDPKGDPAAAIEYFERAKHLHLGLLKNAQSPAALAVSAFFERWNPSFAAEHPVLKPYWDELVASANLIFWHNGNSTTDDAEIRQIWQLSYDEEDDCETGLCLVTGKHSPIAKTHNNLIKGVEGSQPGGASLVSFNEDAFCSYGHEQAYNSPVSSYAAFAYTTALNHLISDRNHCCQMGDTTVVCWATGGQTIYQDLMSCWLNGTLTENDFLAALFELAKGHAYKWDETATLDPETHIYILGLAPSKARLSVRFFWQDTLKHLAENVKAHYDDLKIIRPQYEQYEFISVKSLLLETIRKSKPDKDDKISKTSVSDNLASKSKVSQSPSKKIANPRLYCDLLSAILTKRQYPAALLNGVELRIRSDKDINRTRAAIIKAFYSRSENPQCPKEVLTVQLNEETNNVPYILGRIFALLEQIQQSANPGRELNATIKDRYFNSASSSPANTFPSLINLAQKHLSSPSMPKGISISLEKQLTELMAMLPPAFPPYLNPPQQGAFQIGYYHQTQKRYTKKEEN